VGCTLALALQRAGRPVVLVARHPRDAGRAPAFRPIALSHASRLILERVGAWQGLPTTPIEAIHVSQAGAFGRTWLTAADAGVAALGHVVDYAALGAALFAQAEACGIRILDEPGDAALVVHAEGASAQAREKDYGQEAVLALVGTRRAAGRTAFERFTADGPLALLPFDGRYAVVWGTSPGRARELLEAAPEAFLGALALAFGRRAGEFVSVSERSSVPLALRVRPSRVGAREAYVGNAAQTLHPVAGQGLNLGLRDAWDLARILQEAPDPGEERLLARYAAQRRLDAAATIGITDFLAGALQGADPLASAARATLLGAAMTALDACAPLRRFFARRMIYGSSAVP
jgi:2-octaprenyl-6-methoxyphenol hydroxylase